MMGFDRTDDYQPLTYIGGRPLYVTALLVLIHTSSLVLGAILLGLNLGHCLDWFNLSGTYALGRWQLWRFVSYAFVQPLLSPGAGIFFLIEMFFFYSFGQEVEKYFGRRVFIALYAGLVVVPGLVYAAVSSLVGQGGMPLYGSNTVHFGVFIAFVVLYPNVQFFLNILAKWIAYAFLAIYTLYYLAFHDLTGLLVLWSTVAVAYFGVRYAGGGGGEFSLLGSLREHFPKKTAPSGVKPRLKPRRAAVESGAGASVSSGGGAGVDVHESIDPLLDKISKHGLASLTHSERATLERARASLLRKERGG